MKDVVSGVRAGRIRRYSDVIAMSN